MADLRRRDSTKRPVIEANDRCAVIIERSASLEGLQMSTDVGWHQSRHVAGQVVRMGSDVAKASRRAALRRIRPPRSLLLLAEFQTRPQPSLDVARANRVDLAQFAAQDHFPRLPHQRIAGVVVREREDDIRAIDDGGEFLGLGEVEGQRLVAHDIDARLDRRLGDFDVGVVRCGHRDKVNPLIGWQRGFPLDQFPVRAVSAGSWNVVIRR